MGKIDYDVGDLVVCVDDRYNSAGGFPMPPITEGAVYTVVSITPPASNVFYGVCPGVVLAEFSQPHDLAAPRFRKLPKKSQEFFTGEFHVEPV